MTPAEALEMGRSVLDSIEVDMLDTADPGELERLKREREDVQRILRLAEEREAERRDRERRRPTPSAAQLWAEWQDVKFLRRRNMTARMKAYLISRFGVANYNRLRW